MYCHIFAARTKRFSFGNFCCFNFSSVLTSMNLTSWQASAFIEETNYLINSFVSFHGFASACTRQQSESMHVCLHEFKNLTPTPVIDSSETISPGRLGRGPHIDVFFHTRDTKKICISQKFYLSLHHGLTKTSNVGFICSRTRQNIYRTSHR